MCKRTMLWQPEEIILPLVQVKGIDTAPSNQMKSGPTPNDILKKNIVPEIHQNKLNKNRRKRKGQLKIRKYPEFNLHQT